jgi:hypothetical protein
MNTIYEIFFIIIQPIFSMIDFGMQATNENEIKGWKFQKVLKE